MATSPNPKEDAVLDFIIRHVEQHGFQPSKSEIGEALGISYGGVQYRLQKMAAKGLIAIREGGKERAIVLRNIRFRHRKVREGDGE